VTFDDIRKLALAWPEVEDGTSYGTPAFALQFYDSTSRGGQAA
jgi:hypothetical protein